MKPDELSPASRALLDAAGDGDQPSGTDRTRVRGALFAQLGIPAGGAGAAAGGGGSPGTVMNASSAPQAGASGAAASGGAGASGAGAAGVGAAGAAKIAVGAAIAIGVAGGGYALLGRPDSEPAARTAPAAVVARGERDSMPTPDLPAPSVIPDGTAGQPAAARGPDSAPALPTPEPAAGQRPPAAASEPARPHHRPSPPAADASTILQEQALISSANAALRDGDPAAALRLLDDHASRFPNGTLLEERSGARVLALCDLHHADAARATARFLARWPRSVLATRIRAACK